ncbi:hypothetical protein AC629_41100 [Bradyrhizobium sp. NAS80.1]|nr:hypothetical protein AC629_41100 [Bradyrhizobium sp. NAS80.1]
MRRREFIAAMSGVAAWAFAARAQQPRMAKIAYLGVLSPSTLDPRQLEALRQGLAENGLIEGINVEVDYLWGEGNPDRVRELAADLAQRNLDVIIAPGTAAVRALIATGTKIPIVFPIVGDPVGDRLIASLSRPGGNVTGLSMFGIDLESKRIEVLKEAVPTIKRIMILHYSAGEAGGVVAAVQSAARSLGLDAILVESQGELDSAFARAKEQGVDGLVTTASAFLYFNRKRFIELAAHYRLPSIWEASVYVRDGGLLSYGPSFVDMYRRSAAYVAKILKGAKPADLPVEQPIKFELAVNLKTAKALGIIIPPTLLARADEMIE